MSVTATSAWAAPITTPWRCLGTSTDSAGQEGRSGQRHARAHAQDGESKHRDGIREAGHDIAERQDAENQHDQVALREPPADPLEKEELHRDVDDAVGGEEVAELPRAERMAVPGEGVAEIDREFRREEAIGEVVAEHHRDEDADRQHRARAGRV